MLKNFVNQWSYVIPVLAGIMLLLFPADAPGIVLGFAAVLLIGSVIAAVHHAEELADIVGEPMGTVVLTISITLIEVSLIVSLMAGGKPGSELLARDTLFSAVMLILNGIMGLSLLLGALRHRTQRFSHHSASIMLGCLVAILSFTFILPNFTTSTKGPYYSVPQLVFVSVLCLIIYIAFLRAQIFRHKDYFTDEEESQLAEERSRYKVPDHPMRNLWISLLALFVSLLVVVLVSKKLTPGLEMVLFTLGAPQSFVGIVIAAVVLLPEGISAIKAAIDNRIQTSINLGLGSALASIGLSIPTVAFACIFLDIPLALGLDLKSIILMLLSVMILMMSLIQGKSNFIYGTILLCNLLAYLFISILP